LNHLEISLSRKTQLRIPKKFKIIETEVAKNRLMMEVEPKKSGAISIAELNVATFKNIEKV
jgi:hypothetical protein